MVARMDRHAFGKEAYIEQPLPRSAVEARGDPALKKWIGHRYH
jgi:hypothetical protein